MQRESFEMRKSLEGREHAAYNLLELEAEMLHEELQDTAHAFNLLQLETVYLQDEISHIDPTDASDIAQGFSSMATFAIAVNMIIGAGILGLPYAFYQAGAWFSIFCLGFATLLSSMTIGYLVEATGWAEGLMTAADFGEDQALVTPQEDGDGDAQGQDGFSDQTPPEERFKIRRTKYEMTELCGIFLGVKVPKESWFYRFASNDGKVHTYRTFLEWGFILYTFGSCWLYASVFASTLSSLVPMPFPDRPEFKFCWSQCPMKKVDVCNDGCAEAQGGICEKDPAFGPYCWNSYWAFIGLFAVLQTSLSTVNLNAFKNLQILMSAMSFVSIAIMILTCLVGSATDEGANKGANEIPPFKFGGLMNIITSGLFAQMCHQGVPTVLVLMKEKKKARNIFGAALAYSLSIYVLLSFVTSFYFGPKTNPIITLNWSTYTGGAAPGDPVPWWASMLAFIVMMFPVISVTACFSLQIICLAETVYWMLPAVKEPMLDPVHTRMALRVAWSLAPIFCSLFERDIELILDFNGLFGFFLAYFTPCFLQLAARAECTLRFGSTAKRNPYSDRILSHPLSVWLLIGLSVVLFIVVFGQVVDTVILHH